MNNDDKHGIIKAIYYYRWFCDFCGTQNPDKTKVCYICRKNKVKRKKFLYKAAPDPSDAWRVKR